MEAIHVNGSGGEGKRLFDVVINGVIYKGVEAREVMIETASQISLLNDYPPGSIAANADYSKVWRLAANGTWAQFVGGEE